MLKIKIKKLVPDAILPSYAYPGDAGMDLYAAVAVAIAPGEKVKVSTGIRMEIPDGFAGLIWDKSGLAMNSGLKTLGGVVDAGYRGEIQVGIVNLSGRPVSLEKGHKVAQMIIQKKESVELEEVAELGVSERGENGFGSTGK